MTFCLSKLDRILRKVEIGIHEIKIAGETICRKNRRVDRHTRHDLVTEIGDLLLPSTFSVADSGFSGFPPTDLRVEAVARLLTRTCVYIPTYNNVTHTPHVRLFLLFRPVARGACPSVRGWFRQAEKSVRSRR